MHCFDYASIVATVAWVSGLREHGVPMRGLAAVAVWIGLSSAAVAQFFEAHIDDCLIAKTSATERVKVCKQYVSEGFLRAKVLYGMGYYGLGTAQMELGEYGFAIQAFTKSYENDPTNWSALERRGSAYLAQGNYDQAIADFNRCIDAPQCQGRRGEAYFAKQDYARAIPDLEVGSWIDKTGVNAAKLTQARMILGQASTVAAAATASASAPAVKQPVPQTATAKVAPKGPEAVAIATGAPKTAAPSGAGRGAPRGS